MKTPLLQRCTVADAPLTAEWLVRQYGFERAEVARWLKEFRFDWPLSVKAVDDGGEVVGLLNMSAYRIGEEAEGMVAEAPARLARLDAMRYTAVFSFIVAENYRHTRLNYLMIKEIWDDWVRGYDFVFIPVMHRLKTHGYWQRWGAVEFFRDADCVYYMLPLSERARSEARQFEP